MPNNRSSNAVLEAEQDVIDETVDVFNAWATDEPDVTGAVRLIYFLSVRDLTADEVAGLAGRPIGEVMQEYLQVPEDSTLFVRDESGDHEVSGDWMIPEGLTGVAISAVKPPGSKG